MTHRTGGEAGEDSVSLAPVTPLFDRGPSERHPAHGHALRSTSRAAAGADEPAGARRPVLRAVERVDAPFAGYAPSEESDAETTDSTGSAPDPEAVRESAERTLLRKLRAKALSVSEARLILRGEGLATEQGEEIIDDCLRRGYLDDRVLAELLVRTGVERRGQGRVALARSLSQRGLDRAVIDEALAELPDDDAERALEFARSKARSLARLDPDTALRRLLGQLARRGFGGGPAMNAAKQALREASGGSSGGVRFQ